MSNLYDKASLIITPNAYKASKIYSLKPTDGSGDLAFSRAGSKMVRNSSGLWETIGTNIPPLHYPVGGGCPSWLFEAEATNIITDSLAAAVDWTIYGGATITDESVSAPFDGVTSAIKVSTIILAHSGCYKGMSRASAVNANWVIVKKGTLDYCGLYDATGGVVAAWFNIANGTIGTIAGGYTATIADEGDGWYRCAISKTAGEAASIIEVMFTNTDNSSVGAIGDSYLCFAQNELGRTATSPIITAGSSMTRLKDAPSKTGISALIGQTEGSIFFDVTIGQSFSDGIIRTIALLYAASDADSIAIYRINNNIILDILVSGVAQANGSAYAISSFNTRLKGCITYRVNSVKTFINGALSATDTAALIPACSKLDEGNYITNFQYNGEIKDVILYQTALSDSEAIELTTL